MIAIGNILQDINGKEYVVKTVYDRETVLVEGSNELMFYGKDLVGISLWNGILEKAGFEEKCDCWNLDRSKELGHHFGDFAILKYDNTQVKIWRGDRYCGIVHCEFFHDLQNILEVLVGKLLKK